jgi:hypothetical protein
MFDYEKYHRISDQNGSFLMRIERKPGDETCSGMGEVLRMAVQAVLHEVAVGDRAKPTEVWVNATRGVEL